MSSPVVTKALAAGLANAAKLLQQGQLEATESLLAQLRRLAPGHPEILHLSGHLETARGASAAAVECFRQATRKAPDNPVFQYNLGLALVKAGDYSKALKSFQGALRLGLNRPETFSNLAGCQQKLGRLQEARTLYQQVTELAPGVPSAWLNLAKINLELRDRAAAVQVLVRAESLATAESSYPWADLAQVHALLEDWPAVERTCAAGLAVDRGNAELWFRAAAARLEQQRLKSADEALQHAVRLGYHSNAMRILQARMAIAQGDVADGLARLAEVERAVGDDVPSLLQMSAVYSLSGATDREQACLLRVLELAPDNTNALAALAAIPGVALDAARVRQMRQRVKDATTDPGSRCSLAFALGNHFAHAGDHDRAFGFYAEANRSKAMNWDGDAYAAWVDDQHQLLDREFFHRAASGSASTLPLLVVGMPRSGTSLVEQILAGHSLVHGAGEIGYVSALSGIAGDFSPGGDVAVESLRGLAGDALQLAARRYLDRLNELAGGGLRHVINKLPHNFEQLGLFGLLFPDAPVIHVRRDPRDTLLSIYFQDFAGKHAYAYDMDNLARIYWEQERLMQHWKQVLPNPLLTIDYEQLVGDLPGRVAEMVDFLHLEFEPQMLEFHRLQREVRTASKWQVRQPLYTSSIGRWRTYAPHLHPLLAALDRYSERAST